MRSAAQESGRDPVYALAMADENVDLPEYGAGKGELLTLTAEQALEVGYSEGTVKDRRELISKLGYEQASIKEVEESFAEKVARFITNPVVTSVLITIGSLGLVLELYSPGFGIPGFMGISSLLLFFYGHMVAGLAGYEAIILFAVGVGLMILEFFIAGGIVGIIGFIAVIASFFMASGNVVHMGITLLIAMAATILVSILMVKVLGKRMKLFGKIILTDSTSTEGGYVSNKNRTELMGLEGITVTALRPSGTIIVGDERLDVVSEGSFIQKDKKVKIVKTEGSRIVVREIPE
jgi:membrane-bound serine protease (ClpP class)